MVTSAPSLDPDRFLSFTVVAEPLESALAAVLATIEEFGVHMVRTEGPLNLARIYQDSPPAGGAHSMKVAIYTPASNPGCSVIVTNYRDGWSSLTQ